MDATSLAGLLSRINEHKAWYVAGSPAGATFLASHSIPALGMALPTAEGWPLCAGPGPKEGSSCSEREAPAFQVMLLKPLPSEHTPELGQSHPSQRGTGYRDGKEEATCVWEHPGISGQTVASE